MGFFNNVKNIKDQVLEYDSVPNFEQLQVVFDKIDDQADKENEKKKEERKYYNSLSKEEKNELDTIYIPKNAYIQLDINKTTNLVFSEPNHHSSTCIIHNQLLKNNLCTKLFYYSDYSLFNFSCTSSKNREICSPSANPWCTVMDIGIVLLSPIFPMTQRG